MNEILIFAGTTEGRKLSEGLAASGIRHTMCVATEYGEIVLKEHPLRRVHCGRMNQEEIRTFIRSGSFAAVVDATHPYAEAVTENIRTAMQGMDIPYLRLKRVLEPEQAGERVTYFTTNEDCAKALEGIKGNILLTTGSKELAKYCTSEQLKGRLYVRVLPGAESLSVCMEQGICGKQIIAMQGPFTAEMNEALIHQYRIACLVTKQSGISGGYPQKLEAAERAGIPVFVIGQLRQEAGYSYSEICRELERICGHKMQRTGHLEIILAGAGMGHQSNLTGEVQEAVKEADVLLGAERLLAPYQPKLEKHPFYQAEKIIPYLQMLQEKSLFSENLKAVILFSGDSGFYSGCQSLYNALQEEIGEGRLRASLQILPGISSVAYLAACIGESYQDAAVYSMHGKELNNLARRIKRERKLYLLMSGVKDMNRLGKALTEAGMTSCEIVAGRQLSYAEQQISRLTPMECCKLQQEGLYTCFIKNPDATPERVTHGIADGEFIRDKVPMTKEEIREVGICKLKLHQNAVVYDIGSGTGSIAVEIAGLSDDIRVYAIEQKKEAVSLIEKNKAKFQLENLTVLEAKAPLGLAELPAATHAFIGGSSGSLKKILEELYRINSRMRVVIPAVTMETISELKEILSLYPIEQEEIIQMQVNRAKPAGTYHLMQAENPVWICAFNFQTTDL